MINPFANISSKNVQKLLKTLHADTVNFKKGQNIKNGMLDLNSIGIVVNGYLQVIKNNINGNNIIIDECEENGIIEFYYYNSEYEIICKENTQVIFIDINTLNISSENNKQYLNIFIRNLFFILNEKLKLKNERIQILTKKTIRNKLLEYFKVNNKTGSKYIYLPYSFMSLADYLGVDRSALSREIKYLKDEGFIEVKGKRITLLYK